ncbi:uncharacterized protein LOC120419733 [Culex pipiens pallens]|uniref:uncharacterized protein LOC120419733 n=1 Tax=Culex pipiens pallens TaxID=42434 RepID=UPI0019539870|nr:uncharacterized protein LOC120419733 [Culex pipiens pallens]
MDRTSSTVAVALIVVTLLCSAGHDWMALAAAPPSDHAAPSDRAVVGFLDGAGKSEARGDWYNEIGFPQQFFGSQYAIFKVWLFYMLAFFKIVLLLGIWTPGKKEEDELPTLYSTNYGYGNQYYSYPPSWPTYG